MLFDHSRDSQESAVGKFFDVTIEKLPLQQANAETGENFRLPPSVTDVQFLTGSFYIPVKGLDEKIIVKIDTGIFDFASIGFRAASLVPVMDVEGKTLFWEYRGSGPRTEMTEGSLVYLGAQHGMSVKSAGGASERNNSNSQEQHKSTDNDGPLRPENPLKPGRHKSADDDDPLRPENPLKPGRHKSADDDDPLRPLRPRNSLKPLTAEERRKLPEDDPLRQLRPRNSLKPR